jgi:hypothetical protein
LSAEPKCIWIAVGTERRPASVRTVEGRGDYAMTVGATVAFVDSVLSLRHRDPSIRGVRWAAELFTFDELRPAFEARGIRFRERVLPA